ncbi:hypothetical protein HY949_02270 [Candidatus Gottesmanbacteria bacterium]|nr:hypothetical protein [Candidatus Gottesmanbacteria bacterium]
MSCKNKVIIIPGLGDETRVLGYITRQWKRYGLDLVVYSVGWHDGKESFPLKLSRFVQMIDELVKNGNKVSLVGTSAGGSAVVNAFIERKSKIHRVINICGRLKVGPTTGYRSFDKKTSSSPAFAESVRLCEKGIKLLTATDRKKIMTVHAKFGDELVPPETTMINGAHNTYIPTMEHVVSISAALTIFSKSLTFFLLE